MLELNVGIQSWNEMESWKGMQCWTGMGLEGMEYWYGKECRNGTVEWNVCMQLNVGMQC